MIRCQERAKVARKRTWGLSTILGRNSILNIFRVRGSRWKSKMTRTPSGRSSYALIGKKKSKPLRLFSTRISQETVLVP